MKVFEGCGFLLCFVCLEVMGIVRIWVLCTPVQWHIVKVLLISWGIPGAVALNKIGKAKTDLLQ